MFKFKEKATLKDATIVRRTIYGGLLSIGQIINSWDNKNYGFPFIVIIYKNKNSEWQTPQNISNLIPKKKNN